MYFLACVLLRTKMFYQNVLLLLFHIISIYNIVKHVKINGTIRPFIFSLSKIHSEYFTMEIMVFYVYWRNHAYFFPYNI